ncbi:MAG TPA: methylmalonyl Co-A mutase-associated GTPase MeaB [Gemmatimonadaceae bacterium]|nr:methylmalonyl Co-A mutase-associated GTPase MeaB [Gemmatimonadaceae bacterium]
MPARADRLIDDFSSGKVAALARVVSIVENQRQGVDEILGHLHSRLGRARRIGITGPPGAGKSTITTLLTDVYRKAGQTVGVVCVDPTSPFTGGALLGDRVRMERVALDPGVYIRSMATRGSLGGLAAATREVADVLDGFGFDRIIIETVGVGQSELDVARTADCTVVVLVPESGDSIQTLKAGVMEIADIFVVNKSDRPGADRLRSDVELMLGLRKGASYANVPAHHGVDLKRVMNPARAAREDASANEGDQWTPPVLRVVAVKEEGITELTDSLDKHFNYLERTGKLRVRRRQRMMERVVDVVERRMRQRLWSDAPASQWLDGRIDELEAGSVTPYTVADELLAAHGHLVRGASV